jgi:sugar O-acyltransferase (sialic acid O-acetyltransferase NeuD family)
MTPDTINWKNLIPPWIDETTILLYGGGGHGKTLVDLSRELDSYQIGGIVDENFPAGSRIMDLPVFGGGELLPELFKAGFRQAVNGVGGIGNVAIRLQVFEKLAQAGFSFPTLVHPTAWIEPSATLSAGVQVLPLTYVGTDSTIGFGSLLNAHVTVSHDCRIGECVNLSPGATLAGGVKIDDHAQIGMNVTINLNLTIGAGARIGNGATVKADVPPGGRVYAGQIWPERTLSN